MKFLEGKETQIIMEFLFHILKNIIGYIEIYSARKKELLKWNCFNSISAVIVLI